MIPDTTTLPLINGHRIPRLGMGTWPLTGRTCSEAVERAVGLGYRLFDTAHQYSNEDAVGAGIRASGIPRDEVFITSKFNKEDHSVDGVRRAYDASLRRLGGDRLDLFLIHWPVPALDRYVDAWKGLVQLLEDGGVDAIGVSNFKDHHLSRIISETGVVPDVDQIQLSVDIARVEQRAYHRRLGIRTQGWSPLGRGGDLLTDPVIAAMAVRYGKSPAQILLRWHIEKGIVPVPRADSDEHLAQNIDVFDFELAADDLAVLGSYDRGEEAARDPDDPSNGH